MNKFFQWLNGKKTVIGFLLTMLAQMPGISPEASQILLYAGGSIGTVGVLHKGIKAGNESAEENS